LGTLVLGGQGTGKRVGIAGAAINPFGDVANMMTLAGFLGATNPVIQTVLESVGVDFGTAELYPTLRYDPETGRMAGVHTDPISALLGNTIPQTSILTSLLGANSEFRERMRIDPAGAWRTLAGAGGIPIVWRTYDLGAERMKTELARQQAQRDVLTQALKTGNWSEAERYPDLAAALQQIRALPTEALPRPVAPSAVANVAATTGGI
ncbi:MAG: hypothetical protein IT195_12595, partial [Microthrixaceae bacterium]|nr:hypothetical protein [Microthrixaceae bacterium]